MTDKTIILSSKVFFYVRNKRNNQFIYTIEQIESTLASTYLSDKKILERRAFCYRDFAQGARSFRSIEDCVTYFSSAIKRQRSEECKRFVLDYILENFEIVELQHITKETQLSTTDSLWLIDKL